MALDQARRLSETIARERPRLQTFVRARVADAGDAEDIVQEVFSELIAAEAMLLPIEQAGAWLLRVARNRITDFFRKSKPLALADVRADAADDEVGIEDLLPSADAGPEAAYARAVLLEELEAALEELPAAQREVFLAHELEGKSFKELAAETGIGMNTLLARKHYAVLHLRERLRAVYDDFFATGDWER
jgi:RNA polymerase sigma factor (sigma-70 family)